MTDHDRMNYWWRRATQAEAHIRDVHDVLDRHAPWSRIPARRIRRAR